MKVFSVASVLLKTVLSLAGIAFIIKKLGDTKHQDRYKFDLDSAINSESHSADERVAAAKKFNFSRLYKSHYHSMDV